MSHDPFDRLVNPLLDRRRFIRLGAASALTAALAACSSNRSATSPPASSADTASSALPTDTGAPTTVTVVADTTGATDATGATGASASTARTLVIVQLNGGNDALNTLVPADGRYRDARPTLAIPEADLVALSGNTDWSLHPKLAPLAAHWEAGNAVFLPGIGFSDPDHSHFVSLDRWWRADDVSSPTGWLGRAVADGVDAPLYATALGSGAPLLRSDAFQPAVVLQPSGFDFPPALPADLLASLTRPASGDALTALAQATLSSTIAAVGAFAEVRSPAPAAAGTEVPTREGGLDLVSGLDLAARLVTGSVGARIVVVSVGGFDTHSNQLTTHAALLDDLATGIDAFMRTVAAAGAADRTLLVTTSEFGRRVAENASGGFDHGAGGMSMMFGSRVAGGVHSEIDLGDQLDGDVRPSLDPRTMYTACLDWLGIDPVVALGKRYDEVALLRA